MVPTSLMQWYFYVPTAIAAYATVGACFSTVPILKRWHMLAAYRNAEACKNLALETAKNPDCSEERIRIVRDIAIGKMKTVCEMGELRLTEDLWYSMVCWPLILHTTLIIEWGTVDIRRHLAFVRKKNADRKKAQ